MLPRNRRFALAPVVVLLVAPGLAAAADIPCGPVEKDQIRIDGMLDDWEGVAGVDVGGQDADFSFTAKCNFDRDTLFLVVDVRDDRLVRGKRPAAPTDQVVLAFAVGKPARVVKLLVAPGDRERAVPIPRRVRWLPAQKPAALRGIEIADALQPHGWAIELRMPLARVPGWKPGAATIRLGIGAVDVDARANPRVEASLSTSPLGSAAQLGVVELVPKREHVEAFLRDRGLGPGDVRFDAEGRVLAGHDAHVLLAGKTLAVVDDDYTYLDLPVDKPSDVLDVRLADLAGDGRDAIVLRYRETLTGGGAPTSREVVGAWRYTTGGLQRVFAVEVGRARGGSRVENRVSFVKRKAATDIVVDKGKAVGWSTATYHDAPSTDVVPLLLPWEPDMRQRFQFHGDEYLRAE